VEILDGPDEKSIQTISRIWCQLALAAFPFFGLKAMLCLRHPSCLGAARIAVSTLGAKKTPAYSIGKSSQRRCRVRISRVSVLQAKIRLSRASPEKRKNIALL
jgi:hypothetical protein